MDSKTANGEAQNKTELIKNLGNKLADEDSSNIKTGSLSKELEGLSEMNAQENK